MTVNGVMLLADKETDTVIVAMLDTLAVMTRGEWAKMIAAPHNAREHLTFTPDGMPSWPKK